MNLQLKKRCCCRRSGAPQNGGIGSRLATGFLNTIFSRISGSLRGILTAVMLTAVFCAFSNPVEFKQCIPASGSSISSFDFVLEFDIEKALEAAAKDAPGTNVGIGYMGTTNKTGTGGQAILYKGDEITGEEIGMSLTSNLTGKSEGFSVNGNTVKMVFDENIPILSNQEYTIVINNIFYLYKENAATRVTSTKTDFHDNPIILKFIGADVGESKIFVEDSNIKTGESLENIRSVEYSLSSPFEITDGAEVIVKEGDTIIGKTTSFRVSSVNEKTLIVDFADDVILYNGHIYFIILPANSVTLASNTSVGNSEYSVQINGKCTYKIALLSSKVDVDNNGMPTAVTFEYDLPEGTTLNGISMNGSRKGFLSVDGSDVSTDLSNNYSFVENGKGIKWDLSSVRFEPATKYNFTKAGNTLVVFDAKNSDSSTGLLKEYNGEDASISFTTPSVEELGLSPITLGSIKVGRYDDKSTPDFNNGGTYANIETLEIKRKDYQYDGNSYRVTLDWNNAKAYIYDINDGTRTLVKEVSVSADQREDYYTYYQVFIIRPQMDFMQDHTYEIVIPKGVLRISDTPSLYNYIQNDEIVYTVIGNTPAEFTVESCNVENNEEFNIVPPAIVWTLKGSYGLKAGATANIKHAYAGSPIIGTSNKPINISQSGWKTYVSVPLADTETGELRKLNEGDMYSVIIPAGSIIYPGLESLSNPELTVTLKGVDAVEPEPEMVNVNLTVNGLHTTVHQSPKGKTYSLAVTPEQGWSVASVKHGAKTLESNGEGMFVTEPLDSDAELTADLKYDGPWATNDELTDVWKVGDTDIRIFADGGHIVIEGVGPANTIRVYSVAGMLINSTSVREGNDRVSITVAPDQVYIVTVDGVAARIRM